MINLVKILLAAEINILQPMLENYLIAHINAVIQVPLFYF
jgi:hypothetical protein